LSTLIPKRYWLHPRFRRNYQTAKWEFLPESGVQEIVASQGWKGLTGTIEPDIIILVEPQLVSPRYGVSRREAE
jgi:hypothetical protein